MSEGNNSSLRCSFLILDKSLESAPGIFTDTVTSVVSHVPATTIPLSKSECNQYAIHFIRWSGIKRIRIPNSTISLQNWNAGASFKSVTRQPQEGLPQSCLVRACPPGRARNGHGRGGLAADALRGRDAEGGVRTRLMAPLVTMIKCITLQCVCANLAVFSYFKRSFL